MPSELFQQIQDATREHLTRTMLVEGGHGSVRIGPPARRATADRDVKVEFDVGTPLRCR